MLQSPPITTVCENNFSSEVARVSQERFDLTSAEAFCRSWSKQQYENFTVVSWVLPRRVRQDFYNLYAFCRWSDNLADEIPSPELSLELLEQWHDQLRACFGGRPDHPIMLALSSTIEKHEMPIDDFEDLLIAFRQDQRVSRYADDAQLLDYCRHSANPVGRLVLRIAGAGTATNFELSDEICTGLQLANFCQDISRDALAGRIYAPKTLMDKYGISDEIMLAARKTDALQAMLQEWVALTRDYFHRGWPLVRRVPGWLGTDVDLFVRAGLAILKQIERAQFDVWTKRPEVSKTHKLSLLAQSLATSWLRPRASTVPSMTSDLTSDVPTRSRQGRGDD